MGLKGDKMEVSERTYRAARAAFTVRATRALSAGAITHVADGIVFFEELLSWFYA